MAKRRCSLLTFSTNVSPRERPFFFFFFFFLWGGDGEGMVLKFTFSFANDRATFFRPFFFFHQLIGKTMTLFGVENRLTRRLGEVCFPLLLFCKNRYCWLPKLGESSDLCNTTNHVQLKEKRFMKRKKSKNPRLVLFSMGFKLFFCEMGPNWDPRTQAHWPIALR